MDWYKKDLAAYRRATRHLSPLENGVYDRLLTEYYLSEGPLPNDVQYLKNVVGYSNKWGYAATVKVLAQFFPLNGDGLRHNVRADEEIADYKALCSANRNAARSRYAMQNAQESSADCIAERKRDIKKEETPVDKSPQPSQNPRVDLCAKIIDTQGTRCGAAGVTKNHPQSKEWYCRAHS